MKRSGERDLTAGWQRRGKEDLDDVDVLGMVFHPGQLAVDAKFQVIDIAFLFFIGEIEICPAVAEQLFAEGGPVIFIGIWPAVDPDEGERIGGMIAVLHLDKAVEAVVCIVKGDVDGIIDLLLKI